MQRYHYQRMIEETVTYPAPSWNQPLRSLDDIPGPEPEPEVPAEAGAERLPLLNRHSINMPRRYRRFSMLLDRDDHDQPVRRSPPDVRFRPSVIGRAHRASRGREGMPRLRRVESFREPDSSPLPSPVVSPSHHASDFYMGSRNESRINFRRQLRERMLQLRQQRHIVAESGDSQSARGDRPAVISDQSAVGDLDSVASIPDLLSSGSQGGSDAAEGLPPQQRRQWLNIVGPPERSPTLDDGGAVYSESRPPSRSVATNTGALTSESGGGGGDGSQPSPLEAAGSGSSGQSAAWFRPGGGNTPADRATYPQLRRISRLGHNNTPLGRGGGVTLSTNSSSAARGGGGGRTTVGGGGSVVASGIFEESVQRVTLAVSEAAGGTEGGGGGSGGGAANDPQREEESGDSEQAAQRQLPLVEGEDEEEEMVDEERMVEDIMREMMQNENSVRQRYYEQLGGGSRVLPVRVVQRTGDSIALRDGSRLRRRVERHLSEMSPPVSIPLLTPTPHILDRPPGYQDRSPLRSEVGRSPGRASDTGRSPPHSLDMGRSPSRSGDISRSPGRSPARSGDHDAVMVAAARPRTSRGRRSTADAPSTGLSERLQTVQGEMGSMLAGQMGENPFTSRPPSSASEVELELPASSQNSAVSSPIPRPLTARGRHSVEYDTLDSRRSLSSEIGLGLSDTPVPPPTPADMIAVEAAEEDFASDSSSSRPGSRTADRPDSRRAGGSGVGRILSTLPPAVDWRSRNRARRTALQRLQEEEAVLSDPLTRERAASASSALSSPVASGWTGRRTRGDSDSTEPHDQDIGDISDIPDDGLLVPGYELETSAFLPAGGSFDLAPEELDDETEVANMGRDSDNPEISDGGLSAAGEPVLALVEASQPTESFAAVEEGAAGHLRLEQTQGEPLGMPIEVLPHTFRTTRHMNPINHSEPADRLVESEQLAVLPGDPVWVEERDSWMAAAAAEPAHVERNLADGGGSSSNSPQPAGGSIEQQNFQPGQLAGLPTAEAGGAPPPPPAAATAAAAVDLSDATRRHNLDISLLARHIEHMRRICRASLEDLPTSRQRRQIIRLQGIRRMLEDLHRQIRQLQSSVQVEGGGGEGEVGGGGDGVELSGPLPPPARSQGFTASRSRRSPGPARRYLSSRSRLTRAHSQLVSRLHATFRAMELSPDLARRGISPLNDSLTEASRSVLVSHQRASAAAASSSAVSSAPHPLNLSAVGGGGGFRSDFAERARSDLRSMSERLERLLRERREALERRREAATTTPFIDTMHYHHHHPHLGRRRQQTEEEEELDSVLPPSGSAGDGGGEEGLLRPAAAQEGFHVTLGRNRSDIERAARLDVLLDSSSQSESEEERGAAGGAGGLTASPPLLPPGPSGPAASGFSARTSFARTTLRNLSRRDNLTDYFDHESYLQARRRVLRSWVGRTGTRESTLWDAGPSRYLDRIVRMRTAERMLERRLRFLGSPAERLPPLRELIWRRLRRRNGEEEEEETMDLDREQERNRQGDVWDRERNRHREMLREMVDQLSIHQEAGGPDLSLPPFQRFVPDPPSRMYSRMFRMREQLHQQQPREDARRTQNRDFHLMQQMPSSHVTHRIQTWDFYSDGIPDISRSEHNIVVREAKIHNDASVDISEDGRLLVTLVPSNLPMTTLVGLYSLEKESRGQVLATYSLESCAVSVSLSPTSRHLLVGLTSRTSRIISLSPADRQLMAQVFRIKLPTSPGERGRFVHRKDINQVDTGHMSLNCIRWIPVPGQGIVYATNTGLLKILR